MTVASAFDSAVSPSPNVEQSYIDYYDLLVHISVRKFGVPPEDAESLVHEVFVTYLSAVVEIRNPRSYLIGGICNASRHYLRTHARTETLSDDFFEHVDARSTAELEQAALRITMRETVGRLHEKCRRVLRLRYWDGHSAGELAAKLQTTNRYAEKLIHKCLRRAQKMYLSMSGRGDA